MSLASPWLAALGLVALAGAVEAEQMRAHVLKSASCGCCAAWVEHLHDNGFSTTSENLSNTQLSMAKTRYGVPTDATSCHTALIDGYVIEGHVPARDIQRLLAARPDAVGLSVPGMPMGSPGMDFSDERTAYDVVLIKSDGTTETFASYPGE